MCRIDSLIALYAIAQEEGDTEVMGKIAAQVEQVQEEDRLRFERDRPQIMDEMQRARREGMAIVHRRGEEHLIAH